MPNVEQKEHVEPCELNSTAKQYSGTNSSLLRREYFSNSIEWLKLNWLFANF